MNKILIITDRFPNPVVKGDQVITSQMIYFYSKLGFEIHLICNDKYYRNFKSSDFKHYVLKRKFFSNVLNIIFKNHPIQTIGSVSKNTVNLIRDLELKYNFYSIHLVTLRVSTLFKSINNKNIFLHLIDSEFKKVSSLHQNSFGLKKIFYCIEKKRLKKFENYKISKFKKVTLVSKDDMDFIGKKPNLYHLPIFKKVINHKNLVKDPKRIIFTGNLSYLPNKQAIEWFINSCLGDLINRFKVKLVIAGAGNTGFLNEYKQRFPKSISILGYVNDLNFEIAKSVFSIAPIFSGAGIQNKILESLANSTTVVTTSRGSNPIGLTNNSNVLIANNKIEFINCCSRLLEDPVLNKRLGESGKIFFNSNYSEEVFLELYRKLHES